MVTAAISQQYVAEVPERYAIAPTTKPHITGANRLVPDCEQRSAIANIAVSVNCSLIKLLMRRKAIVPMNKCSSTRLIVYVAVLRGSRRGVDRESFIRC